MNQVIKNAIIEMLTPIQIVNTPFDFTDVTKTHRNIAIIPFSTFGKKYDIPYDTIIKWLKTEDACSQYHPKLDRYMIYYNDLDSRLIRSNRYKFSIAHELGHIFLGHLNNEKASISRLDFSVSEYQFMEFQCDKFASYLLYPFSGLQHMLIYSPKDLSSKLMLSGQSSAVAFDSMAAWLKNRNISSISEYKIGMGDAYDDFIFSKYDNSRYVQFHRRRFERERKQFMKEFAIFEDAHWDRLLDEYLSQ